MNMINSLKRYHKLKEALGNEGSASWGGGREHSNSRPGPLRHGRGLKHNSVSESIC